MYKVRIIGDPVLRKKGTRITVFDDKFLELVKEMTKIMIREDGIGLAAPQIGLSIQLLVVDISPLEDSEFDGPMAFVNPDILATEGSTTIEEGCLSVPGVREDVTRPKRIQLHYQDETGREHTAWFDGWMARVLQHEIDHLNGILFVDYLSPLKRQMLINQKAIPEKY